MDSLIKILTQHTGELIVFLLVSTIFLFVLVVVLWRRIGQVQAKWSALMRGANGETIEQLLQRHLEENGLILRDVSNLNLRTSELENLALTAKRYVGLVRYDAFSDVSGSQSFALALYDEGGNGAVLNSIVGRSDCRVYCKPLVRGSSERTLSQEEQRAIREARSDSPKAIVSA